MRPSGAVTKLTDGRIAYLLRQLHGDPPGESRRQMAARWGVTDRRLRQVLQLAREMRGVPHLKKNRRPPAPPLTEVQRALLTEAWHRAPRGATKLYKALLKRGTRIPKMQIYRFMRAQGWVRPNRRKQRPRSRVRYEREHTGSLLHGDFHRSSDRHPHCILWEDDASRMVLAGGEFPEATTEHAVATLRTALREARRWNLDIREVNTDRGTQFFTSARPNPRSSDPVHPIPRDSAFQEFLEVQGIRHVVSRVNNPQTNGKLERLWLEYDRHRWRFETLDRFMEWYNDQIHDALRADLFETPREAFQRKLPVESQLGLFLARVETEVSA